MTTWKDELRDLLASDYDRLDDVVDAAHELFGQVPPFELFMRWDRSVDMAITKHRYEKIYREMDVVTPAARASIQGLIVAGIFTEKDAKRILS